MTPLDQYIQSQVGPMLQPGEQVYHTATMRRQPGLFWQIVLVGGLLLMLMTKVYLVVLTNRRLILVLTKGSFWSGTPKPLNLGVEQHEVSAFRKVTTSGFANNRSMTFHTDKTKLKLRISPWFKSVSGTKDFFEQVPNLINSGQLAHAQLAAPPQQYGAPPPQQYGAPPPQQYGAPPPQQYGAPPPQQYGTPPQQYAAAPQQQQYAAAPQQQQYGAPQQQYGAPQLGPGARVLVLAQDGQRYPGTIVQMQGEHCLCAMQNGQFWFPAQNVSQA
jgi:hypothetical protein